MSDKRNKKNKDEVKGFLKHVENIGNKLPHPAMIFVILSLIIVFVSHFARNISLNYFDAKQGAEVTVQVKSLLSKEGLRYIFNSATTNFTGFAPLGTVLVAMLGVGVAEWTGLINTGLKKMLSNVDGRFITAMVVFAGIVSNIASDAGYVVVIPLGAIIFANAGRHPLAGLAAAFAGVSGGFSANLIFGPTDTLLTGITNDALKAASIDYAINTPANWYFLIISTFVLTIVGSFVTEKIVEKNLGEYTGKYKPTNEPISDLENKGLKRAGLSLLVFIALMGYLMFGPNATFKTLNEATGKMDINYFLGNGLLLMILLLFLIPGVSYGRVTGKIKSSNDIVTGMTVAMEGMGGYLVLAFFAAQFVSYFGETNLGTVISVKGAFLLEKIGLNGFPLILVFIFITAFLNLFMGSASAKWSIMAPIFVPMMYQVGLSPAMTQMAYRIGDSSTNIISPLMSNFAMVVVFTQKYDEEGGLGTLISMMIPYSIAFLISWTILLGVWYFFNIPLGPDSTIHLITSALF